MADEEDDSEKTEEPSQKKLEQDLQLRLVPQLQILFLLLPAQIVAGFLLLMATMAAMLSWYSMHVQEAYRYFLER